MNDESKQPGPGRFSFIVHRSSFIVQSIVPSIAAAMQLFLAHRFFGFLTGDEVEVLGEAFRRALRFPYTPWEVRNLFVPDVVVAPVVWLVKHLGVTDTGRVIELAALPFIALTAVTTLLVRRLALQWSDGDERAATIAMLLFALHWIPLCFGSTVYPRTLAMACIAAAALIAERRPILAGALVGVAFTDRFSEIVFLLPVLLLIPRRQAWRALAGAALVILITSGVYDWLTYGVPFSSAWKFAHLTVVERDFASRVKYQSPFWYATNILRWCAPTLLPLAWLARARVRWAFLAVPLVALSIVNHKELRYVQTLVPFLAVAAGIGASLLWRERRAVAIALVAVSVVWNLTGLRFFARKTQPAVMAARWLATQEKHGFVVSQLWAYGDRLYLGTNVDPQEVGTPPRNLGAVLPHADTASLWETDLDDPGVREALSRNGFRPVRTFRDGPARAVVVFRKGRL
jgi:hypothetical protein